MLTRNSEVDEPMGRFDKKFYRLSIVVGIMVWLCSQNVLAQCTIYTPSPITGCNGTITFTATSQSTTVSHHVWYDGFFNPISPTSENMVEYTPGSGQIAWTSTLEVSLSADATYYVAASCNTSDKRAVTYTSQNGTVIGLAMTPSLNPGDLCLGDTITLSANSGSNYQWRFNDPLSSEYTGGSTHYALHSGTYYLKGTNSCGEWQTKSIDLNFRLSPYNLLIAGPDAICQGTSATQFQSSGENINAVTWSISDGDVGASATIDAHSGLVTWNGITASANVTILVYGCGGTTVSRTKPVAINLIPNEVAVGTIENDFCTGTISTTLFTATGNDVDYYTWGVTGLGNIISETGLVTWGAGYTGEPTITAYAHGCNESVVEATGSISVFSLPPVIVDPQGTALIGSGSTYVELAANEVEGYDYQWMMGNFDISGATSSTYHASSPGTYTVRVTDAHDCGATSSEVAVSTVNNYNRIVENALQTDTLANASLIVESDVPTLDFDQRRQTIQYFDGLGRPMQTVSTQASPTYKDLVQPIVYDEFGREAIRYLPVAIQSNGFYKQDIIDPAAKAFINDAETFYESGSNNKIADDAKPYAVTVFEASPLNRVIEQGAPGTAFQPGSGHTIVKTYEINTATDVLLFSYDVATGSLSLDNSTGSRYYLPEELLANKTFDEHSNEVIEFVDKEGRTVCKKVKASSTEYACTYYLYDDLGNLTLVLPPEGVKQFLLALDEN